MGYSKKAAQEVSDFKSKYMNAGINEGVSIDKVEVKVSPNGNKMFDITFINEQGQTAVHTEWEPKMAPWMKDKSDLERNQARQFKKMLQILMCYYTDEQINFEGEDFMSFANYIATMLNAADKTKKLRLKLVYNKDGYTTIPTAVDDTFIEPMDVTESKIQITAKDIVVRPVIADKEITVNNPFTTPTMTAAPTFTEPTVATAAFNNSTNDLPF
jgi:hypothetical protein